MFSAETEGEIVRTYLLAAFAALCLTGAAPSFAPAKPMAVAAKKKSCKPMAETSGCKLKKAEYSRPDIGGTAITLDVGQYLVPWKIELGRWCHIPDGAPVPWRFHSNTAPTIGRTLTLANVGSLSKDDPGVYTGSATATFAAKSATVTFAGAVSYDGEVKCRLSGRFTLKRIR